MDFVKSLYDDGFAPHGCEDHGKYFQAGNGAVFWGGTWSTGMFEKTDGFNFGAQAFPTIFGKPASWADSHVLIISITKPTSKKPKRPDFHQLRHQHRRHYLGRIGANSFQQHCFKQQGIPVSPLPKRLKCRRPLKRRLSHQK